MMYSIECIEHIDNRIKISVENLETMEGTGTLDLTKEDARQLYLTLHSYFTKSNEEIANKLNKLIKEKLNDNA